MSAEQVPSNIKKIRGIMDETTRDLERYLEVYRTHVAGLRRQLRRDRQEAEVLLQATTTTLNEMKERNERMVEERNELRAKIEQDEAELKASESEKHELLGQIKELEISNSSLKELYNEKRSRSEGLARKLALLEARSKQKEEAIRKKAELYRRYLGVDITPIREDIIKIVFNKVCADEDIECFVMLDLSCESPVIEMFPQIHDFEMLNHIFRGHNNFHDFLRFIRSEFVKEYSRSK
jgi:chromosome segregation ATPase